MQGNKKHGLGKGISSLLDDYSYEFQNEKSLGEVADDKTGRILEVNIDFVHPNPNQPRKNFDSGAISELAASIKANGIIQPLIVEKVTDRKYSIIAGERRYRAAKQAGLRTVPVILRDLDDVERLEVSLIENIQREDLNPVEEAKAYRYLLTEKEITQEELSERVGKSRSAIANSIRILQLPSKMQEAIQSGTISAGHARALLSVINPADQQILFAKILTDGLNVRQTERLAAELNKGKRIAVQGDEDTSAQQEAARDSDVSEVEERFLSVVGTRVEIKGSLVKGKVQIPYKSADELERIYQLFKPDGSLFGDDF
ncbi:MAG: ParB/RepB/Spo0J family partition protein [Sphaerochaetaceae bacterium]